jgi:hypothetical protein
VSFIDDNPWLTEEMEDDVSDTQEYEWEDKDHNVRLIHDLDTGHIEHIIKGLESGKGYWGQVWKLPYLQRVLKRRKGM